MELREYNQLSALHFKHNQVVGQKIHVSDLESGS